MNITDIIITFLVNLSASLLACVIVKYLGWMDKR